MPIKLSFNPVIISPSLNPRISYASMLLDSIIEMLLEKKNEIHLTNQSHYQENEGYFSNFELKEGVLFELTLIRCIESLIQVRRCMDSIFGLGNIVFVLSPTIPILRNVRSQTFNVLDECERPLGELSMVIGGLIIDSGHLTGETVSFNEATHASRILLDEAKLIADSKICKQFPNLDFL